MHLHGQKGLEIKRSVTTTGHFTFGFLHGISAVRGYLSSKFSLARSWRCGHALCPLLGEHRQVSSLGRLAWRQMTLPRIIFLSLVWTLIALNDLISGAWLLETTRLDRGTGSTPAELQHRKSTIQFYKPAELYKPHQQERLLWTQSTIHQRTTRRATIDV